MLQLILIDSVTTGRVSLWVKINYKAFLMLFTKGSRQINGSSRLTNTTFLVNNRQNVCLLIWITTLYILITH